MKKKYVFLLILLSIFLGLWIGWSNKPTKEIVKIEVKENLKKIDSLMNIVSRDSIKIDSLKKVKTKIREKTILVIEKQKTLPPDSLIRVFSDNIKKHGELRSSEPKLTEDSMILCSADNIRDVNIIAAKLESEIEVNENLQEIITLDSIMLVKKNNIIEEHTVIETAYEKNIRNLTADLKKKKRTQNTIIAVGSTIILGLLIFK